MTAEAHDSYQNWGSELTSRHVVPRRHWNRWALAVVALAAVAGVVGVFATSEIAWREIPEYLFSDALLRGIIGTLKLTFAVMALGIILGTLVAVARQSGNPVLRALALGYIWLFRGVPALVQLLLWFNLALVLPDINLGFYSASTNDVMTPFVAALLGLGLSESAFMAEVVRGGILSVPAGQIEAARSIGMHPGQTMRRVILPQAIPVIIPPTGNEFISMLKYTSLAFAVSYGDLLSEASKIYTQNFAVMEVLLSATVWYLILCSIASLIQGRIERYFNRHTRPNARVRIAAENTSEATP